MSNFFTLLFQQNKSFNDVTIKVFTSMGEDSDCYSALLNIEWSLSKVRSELSDSYRQNPSGRICLYKNMYFVNVENGIISHDQENNRKLKDILRDGNILRIKRDHKRPNELGIIEKCRLKYGITRSENKLVQIQHEDYEAFEFNQHDGIVELFPLDADIFGKHKNTTRDTTHRITNRKVLAANAGIFWSSLSAGLNASRNKTTGMMNHGETSMTDDIKVQGRAKVKLTSKEVSPSPKFKRAVKSALESSDPVKDLKEIQEIFGKFWAQEIILGGIIQKSINNTIENNKQTGNNTSEIGSSIRTNAIRLDLQYQKEKSEITDSNSIETDIKSNYIGGDTIKAYTNMEAWVESLEDYANWRIIEYRKVVSIFEILEDNLRERVLEALGEKILYAKIDKQVFRFTSNKTPCKHALDIPENIKKNLKNCQIFATIISKTKGTFSPRVMYTSDQSAKLLIHRFRKSRKNKAYTYSLTIGWIIVGIPSNFNSLEEEFEIKFNEFIPSDKLQESLRICNKHDYPLVTCALKFNEDSLSHNPLDDINIVTGVHFHTPEGDDEHLEICVCNYDLKTCKIVKNLPLYKQYSLYSQCCIVSGTVKQFASNSKKYKSYPKWPCEQPAFASVYQQTHTEGCISGLLKITSKEVIFKNFNDSTSGENELKLHYIQWPKYQERSEGKER
ncbi:3975_t:CDS:2 [Cetraspora pellucida]|uniref:3975_t:CDS:1 n=1 Tax=Cetraspora pellucida TaxID=1433469 RepID=A0ACA9KJ36_9GLOM|nr:3975_t:CDS:2 [Cetraspora pellucida]